MITLNVVKYFNGPWRSILGNRLSGNIVCVNKTRPMSTIDSKAVEYHSGMKNIWWDENGPLNGLHTYNPLRIQFVKDGLINVGIKLQNSDLPLRGFKIVDVGCGGGILTEGLAREGAQVTGIDASAELIDIAKEHVKLDPDISERVNYIQTTVEDFARKPKETYDAVVTSEVLEHVANPQIFLKECVKIVKPGKSIFITTINKTLTSLLSTIVAAEYIFGSAPRGNHQWNKFIAPHKVQRILENYGCETKLIRGMHFNPATRQWSRSSTASTFYGLHAIKHKGTGILSGNIVCVNKTRPMSTIDSKAVEYHSAMKNIWWDENGPINALHSFNPLRIQFVKDGLINAGVKLQNSNLPLKGFKIVEVGCGGGILTEGLARVGAQVTGIDASAELIDIAKEHVKLDPDISERVNYIQTTVEDFARKPKETYDALVTSEVLEHVANPQIFLKECVKIVKPGKSIFITTINKTLTSLLSTIVATEYIFGSIPRGTHQWNKFIAPHKVQRILENYGCETKLIRGMHFNPATRRWSRPSTVSTFYGLHAIKHTETSV